jgi:hypothetical protein
MSRYMCRKNYLMEYRPFGEKPFTGRAFTAGEIYHIEQHYDWVEMEDNYGHMHILDADLLNHFTELSDDLPVPRDEAYPEPFTTPEPRRNITAGWAWFIVLMTTLTAIILSEIL